MTDSIDDPTSSHIVQPTLDVMQDHPAALDWRLIVVYVAFGLLALYLL
ncbi:MAG: hypothetical protein N2C14_22610 [Planctomycetales bacterium]